MIQETRPPYIEFQDVEVRYTPHVFGLRGINLSIRRGDFVFFVGRTGAGKSTLIKLLTREVKHDAGIVRFHGRDLGQVRDREIPALRREMGIVPQDFALLPRKRVWENVAYAMRAIGNSRRTVRRRVPEILERVSVGHRADAFPNELSGGEQQRVAIGRALINNPPLILADEPTGNLDPQHSWEIMELLRSLNARGATVLVATHDMTVVERMARRIVTLDAGIIVNDTAPEGVLITHPLQQELEWDAYPQKVVVTKTVDLKATPPSTIVEQPAVQPEPEVSVELAADASLEVDEIVLEAPELAETTPSDSVEAAPEPNHVLEPEPDEVFPEIEQLEHPSAELVGPEQTVAPVAEQPSAGPVTQAASPSGTVRLRAVALHEVPKELLEPDVAPENERPKVRVGPKRDKSRPPLGSPNSTSEESKEGGASDV